MTGDRLGPIDIPMRESAALTPPGGVPKLRLSRMGLRRSWAALAAAWSPRTGWVYIPVLEICSDLIVRDEDPQEGRGFTGGNWIMKPPAGAKQESYLAAFDPVTCVCYYGSAIPDALGLAGQVRCPILFHFGDADDYIPAEKQRVVREAFAGHVMTEFHVHEGAGHAFDNHNSAVMYRERAAREAWVQTIDFLKRTLPV